MNIIGNLKKNTASENPETGYTDNRFYNTTIELLRDLQIKANPAKKEKLKYKKIQARPAATDPEPGFSEHEKRAPLNHPS